MFVGREMFAIAESLGSMTLFRCMHVNSGSAAKLFRDVVIFSMAWLGFTSF